MSDQNELSGFWSAANQAATKSQRQAFNAYHDELYLVADRLRDELRLRSRNCAIPDDINVLIGLICKLPLLIDDREESGE